MANDGMLTSASSGRGNNELFCSQWLLLCDPALNLPLVDLETEVLNTNPSLIATIYKVKKTSVWDIGLFPVNVEEGPICDELCLIMSWQTLNM
jgi:hypothetical protein